MTTAASTPPSGVARRRVGIDVGGTKVQGVALDGSGAVVASIQRPTPRGTGGLDALVDVLAEVAVALEHGAALGVGVPGLVTHHGVLRAAPNLDGVADFGVGDLLADRLGVRVYVDNDATCATIAEWVSGAGCGVDDMVLVTLGTGIGGGVVAGGVLQRGRNGFVGEFGHMVVDPLGPPCPCGRRGCWERYASGTGLATLALDAAIGGRLHDVVARADGDPRAVRGEHVLAAAIGGDAEALAVVDDFARWVALGLSNLANALDPEVFVLGGGLAASGAVFLGAVERWLAELLYQSHLRIVPRVVVASWGPLAGAVGAALLPAVADRTRPT